MIKWIEIGIEIACDGCQRAESVSVRLTPHELKAVLDGRGRLREDQLPDLWAYFTSGGYGMTGYTKEQLFCPSCDRVQRGETVLDHLTRKAHEK